MIECCALGKSRFAAYDGVSRIMEEEGGTYLVLCTAERNPFITPISFCPWCGSDLRARNRIDWTTEGKTRPIVGKAI